MQLHIYPDGGLARLLVYGIAELDRTKFVSGKFPNEKSPDEKTRWKTIIEQTKLKADERRIFIPEIKSGEAVFNYAKFNIFPDGGVGRLNIFCELV